MVFEFSSATRLVFGEGVFERLGTEAAALGRRALIVTSARAMRASGHLDRARALLDKAGVACAVFDRIPPNPTDGIVDEGAALAREYEADLVIGLGGGSAMDAGKAIAICARHETPCRRFLEPDAAGNKAAVTAATLPVLCVTSTAGTASELTPFAVITVTATRDKSAIRSPHIQPRVSLDDPELTYSVPANISAATGVDVLCHAMEAFLNLNAGPLTDLLALEAVRLVGRYLPRVVADGSDREARRQMLLANCYAGYGLANAGATIMHALEHPVSGHYPAVAHGAGLAACVLPWARKMAAVAPDRLALVGAALDGEASADGAVAALGALLRAVGMDLRLRELGVAEDNLERMAADSCRYMALAVDKTPGRLTCGDVLELLEEAY